MELRGVCFLESVPFLFQHLRGRTHTYAPASLTSRRMVIFPRLLKDSLRRRSVWGKKEKDFNLMTL